MLQGQIQGVWQHDLFQQSAGAGLQQRPTAGGDATARFGKLLISNLDFGVNDSDIQVIFELWQEMLKDYYLFELYFGCHVPCIFK